MAYYFGANVGTGVGGSSTGAGASVVEGAATTGMNIEVVIPTNANVPTKQDLLNALDVIGKYIAQTNKNW